MYRFYLNRNDGYEYGEITPLGFDKFEIKHKQQENEKFYRPQLNNDVILSRLHDQSVYDEVIDYYETNQYRDIYLYVRAESNLSENKFSGVTTFRKAKVDKDKCQVTFKFEPNDSYRKFIQNNNVKFNILNAQDFSSVRSPIYSILEFSDSDNGGNYYRVKSAVDDGYNVLVYATFELYARERVNFPFNSTDWENITTEEGNRYSIRQWLDNYIDLESYVEFGEPNHENHPISSWTKVAEFYRSDTIYLWAYISNSYNTEQEYSISYSGLRRMSNVLEYLIGEINPNVNFDIDDYSNFFNNNGSALSGGDAYQYISIAQKSDMIYPGGVSATIGEITWQEYVNIYKYLFNAWWYIDSENNFRMEYLEDLPIVTQGIDATLLTDPSTGEQYISGTENYSFLDEEIPQREELLLMESSNEDFIGKPITYDENAGNETVKQYNLQYVTTDLKYIQTNASSISTDGFFIAQIEEQGSTLKYYEITESTGVLSSSLIINANMSTANLMDKFWRAGRQLKYGYLNGQQVEFSNAKKTKVGGEITFPLCSTEFNAANLVKSLHGWGEIIESSLSLQNGWIKIKLRFDDNSQL